MKKLLSLFVFLLTSFHLSAQLITGEAEYIQEFSHSITTSHEGFDSTNQQFLDEEEMTVDLDGNGVVDITFKLKDSHHGTGLLFTHSITCQYDTSIINICQFPINQFATLFDEEVEFLANCENWVPFNPTTLLILSTGGPNGYIFNPGSRNITYLAFKYDLMGEEVIGWIKLGFSNPSYFTLLSIGTNIPLETQVNGNFTNLEEEEPSQPAVKLPLHPNPTQKSVFIDCSEYAEEMDLTIYNSFGQKVQNTSLQEGLTHEVSLSNIPSGIYYFVLAIDDERTVEKIILTK